MAISPWNWRISIGNDLLGTGCAKKGDSQRVPVWVFSFVIDLSQNKVVIAHNFKDLFVRYIKIR